MKKSHRRFKIQEQEKGTEKEQEKESKRNKKNRRNLNGTQKKEARDLWKPFLSEFVLKTGEGKKGRRKRDEKQSRLIERRNPPNHSR